MTANRSLVGRGVAVRRGVGCGVAGAVAMGVAAGDAGAEAIGVATGLADGVGAGVGLGDGGGLIVGSTLPVGDGIRLGVALGLAATPDGDAAATVVADGAEPDACADELGSWKPVSSKPPRWSTNPNEKPIDASRTTTAATVARGMRDPLDTVSGL